MTIAAAYRNKMDAARLNAPLGNACRVLFDERGHGEVLLFGSFRCSENFV